jgi:hypothetical protein
MRYRNGPKQAEAQDYREHRKQKDAKAPSLRQRRTKPFHGEEGIRKNLGRKTEGEEEKKEIKEGAVQNEVDSG